MAFTSKILLELSRKKIITSVKGPGGGFYLSPKNLSIPIIEIIKAMGDISYIIPMYDL